MPKYRKINDLWSLYKYGNKYKVVYIKCGSRRISGEDTNSVKELKEDNISEERLSASLSRTKSRILELALCNEFTFFCTFTQDKNKVVSRFDLSAFRKDLAQYIRNQNRGREDKIQYLLIPERHKDGAWHMHGLFSGLIIGEDLFEFSLSDNIPQRIKKSIKNGEMVYNWDNYSKKFGFFTATRIKSTGAVSSYITKYVTKEVAKQGLEEGRHLFFASQGLKGKEAIVYNNFDLNCELVRCPFLDNEWSFENDYVKVKWLNDLSAFNGLSLSKKTDIKN